MSSAEKIKKLFAKSYVTVNSKVDDRIVSDALTAFNESEKTKPVSAEPNIWRLIMKNRITKLAAAAVIIIAVFLGLNITGGPDMAGVAWGEVIRKAEMISALMAEMTVEITFQGNEKLITKEDIYIAGDYGTRQNIYMNGELFLIKYRLPNKKIAYQIQPKEKEYVRLDLSDEEADTGCDPDDPRQWLKKILSGEYVELGHGNINGIDVEGIESQNTQITGSEGMTMRLWVAVETNLPVRIELEGENWEAGKMRSQKFIMDNFQWNVELDASLFEPDIPDDYTQVQPQTQIQPQKEPEVKEPPKILSEDEKREQIVVKELATALFQACANKDWEEFSKLWPGLLLNKMQKSLLGGLEIISIGDPFKSTDSSIWYVPYESKRKLEFGRIRKNSLRIRYDEATQKYIPRGGL